jgi:hypothetical protein
MSDVIGQLSFKAPQSEFGLEDRPYSQATADKIDFEARKLIREVRGFRCGCGCDCGFGLELVSGLLLLLLLLLFFGDVFYLFFSPFLICWFLTYCALFVHLPLLTCQAEERTRELLTQHKDDLVKVAEKLLEKEKLNKDDMIELLGERQWKELRTYQELSH